MAREGRDVISVYCINNTVVNIMPDADGIKDIWRKCMEKLLNVVNDWDGDVDCPEMMGPCCLILEEQAAYPTGVLSNMMKGSGGGWG